ncbi:ABC transporter permease [Halomonas sp. LY9]
MSKSLTLLKRMPVTAMVGLLLTFSFLIMAVFAPWLAPYSMSESVGDMWMGPSAEFWLGTDNLGRDLLSRLMYGARTTMTIAALATALAFSIGSVLGILAAVYGGWVDQAISRGVDIVMSIPTLIFALVILSVMPSTMLMLILIMGILDSTRVFRISRAVAVNINVMDFVEAARLRGEGKRWIVFREILPNALTP